MLATEEEMVYVGAIFDLYGEANLKVREDGRFTVKLSIRVDHKATVEKVRDYLNLGNVRIGKRGIGRSKKAPIYIYSVYNSKAIEVINLILPFTSTKSELLESVLDEAVYRKRKKYSYVDVLKEMQCKRQKNGKK